MTFAELPIEGWLTLATIAVVMLALMSNRIGPDVVMMGGLTLLMIVGAIAPDAAIAGFAHRAVIMIGSLYVVAAGLTETGAMEMVARWVLGRPTNQAAALLRLMVPVALISAFMNNTAVVAMYMPIVSDWSKKLRISPSKLLLPLSYASILGGTCTLIATASNVTVTGLYLSYIDPQQNPFIADMSLRFGLELPTFWWVTVVGVPATIIGIAFVVLTSRWLLPDRQGAASKIADERQYLVEMMVEPNSPLAGVTIEAAGLRHLPGLYLSAIERGGEVLHAVGPQERLEVGDVLVFVGIVQSVVDLRKIRGLVPATDEVKKVKAHRRNRTIAEAVVSNQARFLGQTVRAAQFRTKYNAAIIAVHRHGHRIEDRKIGDIRLQAGDTLLLDTHDGFVKAYRNSRDFFLVSRVDGAREIRHERAWLSLGILGAMVLLLILQYNPLVSVLVGAGLMVLTRCVTGTVARNSIGLQVLIVIGAALGIGRAMTETGAAEAVANFILDLSSGLGPHGYLFVIFMLTSVLAQFVTNNGAAVLMFPIAMAVTRQLDVNPEPFVVALMVAAACNFMTPIAYQTNLMVYGPGGYRFSDFTKIGIPLTVIVAVVTTIIAPLAFGFHPQPGPDSTPSTPSPESPTASESGSAGAPSLPAQNP